MLHDAKLDITFWAEAIGTMTYIRNRSPTRALSGKTPEELWSGIKPKVHHMRIFGCEAFAHIPKIKRQKFQAKGVKCIFVGYANETKGYRLWNPTTKRIIISRDVIFDEGGYMFRHSNDNYTLSFYKFFS